MRKSTGAISAFAFVATALAIWWQTAPATNAAGLVHDIGAVRASEEAAPAKFADRFPGTDEMFRPVAFRQTEGTNKQTTAAATGKADRLQQGNIAPCGQQSWPFMGADCFSVKRPAAEAKPPMAPPAKPAVTIERRLDSNTSELVRTPVSAAPQPNATMLRSSCKQDLVTASAIMERVAHTKAQSGRDSAETCAAYRRDFFEVVRARELTALCRSGADRTQELGRIDTTVDNINGAIAQSCGT